MNKMNYSTNKVQASYMMMWECVHAHYSSCTAFCWAATIKFPWLHKFPDLSLTMGFFPDLSWIPWHFRVSEKSGNSVTALTHVEIGQFGFRKIVPESSGHDSDWNVMSDNSRMSSQRWLQHQTALKYSVIHTRWCKKARPNYHETKPASETATSHYGALVATLARLLRLMNCCFNITVIIYPVTSTGKMPVRFVSRVFRKITAHNTMTNN